MQKSYFSLRKAFLKPDVPTPKSPVEFHLCQGQDTGATLGLRDTYYLARTAALQEQSGLAVRLLEEAVGMAGRQHNSTANQQQVQPQ